MRGKGLRSCLLVVLCSVATLALAGGPLLVGGPGFGIDGQPFTWNPAKMPIAYRVDPGPMSVSPTGTTVVDNATGLRRVRDMFSGWQGVSTASISFTNAGALLPAGSYQGGDLTTLQQYNDVIGSCKSGAQSPIIFDANGSILSGLGLPPEVIGFTSHCGLDTAHGYLMGAAILMNGKFQDGVNSPNASPANYELSQDQFDQAITHEIGHLIGLDHSQINLDLLLQNVYPCNADELAGLPLMFPTEMCQSRKSAGLPVLAPDDLAWLSMLYPSASFGTAYGTISGTIYFSDGISQVQGANVIARRVDDANTPQDESRRVAVSVVSGYRFTGNPGQSVTADMPGTHENNTKGDPNGSRNATLIGYYEIAVPPGAYTVEVESVHDGFTASSSVGPLSPPVPLPGEPEFWNKDESAFDFPLQRDAITVTPGAKITGIDIILNRPTPRFDQYEDSGALWDVPLVPPLRDRKQVAA